MVGEERIELSLLAKHDFESCASTSSAIRPLYFIKLYLNSIRTKFILKPKNVSKTLQKMFRISST